MLCLKRLVYSIIVTIILIAVTYFPVYAKDINSSSYKHESTSTVIKGSTEGNRIDNSPYKGMATEGVILENYKNTSIGRVAIYSSDNAVYDIHEDSKLITVMGENGDEIYFSAETLNAYDIGPYSAMLSGNWMAPKNSYYYYGFMYSPYESDLCNNNTAKTESVHYIPLLNENIKVWLLPKTTYYYVAYICNPSTYEYIYGNVKSFTTSDGVVDNIGNGFSNQMTKDNSKWFSWRPNVSGWYTFSADGPGEASICSSVLKTLNKNTSINDPIEVKYYLNADTDYYILFTPYTSRMFNFSITPSVLPDLINTQKFLTKPYSYQYFQFRPDTTDVYTLPFNESCTYKIYDNNMKFLFFLDSYNASSCSLQMLLIQDALYYIEMYSYIS